MKFLCLIAMMCLCAKGEEGCDGGDVVHYLDEVLAKVKSEMPDPLPLPSKHGEGEHDATLTEGVAWGIDTLKRTGPATVECGEDAVTIKAVLGVDEMSGRYKWEKYIGGFLLGKRRSGFLFIKATEFEIEVVIREEYREDAKASLESLKITKMSGIDVELTGWNYVTWIASYVLDPVAKLFKSSVTEFVEESLRQAVARQIAQIRVPVNRKSF